MTLRVDTSVLLAPLFIRDQALISARDIEFIRNDLIATKGEATPIFSTERYPAKILPINSLLTFRIGDPLLPGLVGILYIEKPSGE